MEYREFYTLTEIEPGIIRCEFMQDFIFTETMAKRIFNTCDQMAKSRYKMLWVMRNKLSPDHQVMDAFANPIRAQRVIAEAFCLESSSLKLLANFYFKIKKPPITSISADSEASALSWLKGLDG